MYELGLGAIPAAPRVGIVVGMPPDDVAPVSLAMDAGDLIALPAVGIAYLVGLGRLRAGRATAARR